MSERVNRFTGKPQPGLDYSEFGRPAGYTCDECDTDVICDCLRCGAPNCCPRCCAEASAILLEKPTHDDH